MNLKKIVLTTLFSFFVLPVFSFAESDMLPVWKVSDARSRNPMKIALGPCQSQCFEGSVEYNSQSLKLVKVERYDNAKKSWTSIPLDGTTREGALRALEQVTQNLTLPGFCTESECSCRMPENKPPFGAWTNITVYSDYVSRSYSTETEYRATGTVDYRSRVAQGQCDLSMGKQTASGP